MILPALTLAMQMVVSLDPSRDPNLPQFMVGTKDSARLSEWLLFQRLPHRAFPGGLFEVEIPPGRVGEIAELPGVDRIEAPTPQTHHVLDPSRIRVNAEPVHIGKSPATRAYRGTGVLVGIIDVGFDLQHPAFLDSAGKSRIVRLWDHTTSTGSPPSGFSIGTLFSATNLASKQRSGSLSHHGTHVAGLAAGRARAASGGEWWGVADDARIALVECGNGCPRIGDGLEYLYKLADSLGIPAVVNMSWGSLNGPRDGKSSDCVRANALVGRGKLAVVSAGNSGGEMGHAVHRFSGDTAHLSLQVAAGIQTRGEDTLRKLFFNEAELWGDSAQTYVSWVEFRDSASGTLLKASPVYASPTPWKSISEEMVVGRDTFWVSGNLESRAGQGGARLSISTSRSHTVLRVGMQSAKATVHAWIWEEGLEFKTEPSSRCPRCLAPDKEQMISDKATCPQFVSVGAIDGADGKPVSFTSRGPGRAMLPKPDISAPGYQIVSALNSAVDNGAWVVGSENGFDWGPMSGTSMSSPLVTGALALLLEADPELDPREAIALIKGSRSVHDPAIGWRSLDVLGLFQDNGVFPAGVTKPSRSLLAGPESRSWLTPDGTRIVVPEERSSNDYHPGGIAWLQTCTKQGCTSRGVVRTRATPGVHGTR